LFELTEEIDLDLELDVRRQDLTYELERRPEVDPLATYTLLASPVIEDQTIVDSSATLVGPAFVRGEGGKSNQGRALDADFDEDEDENTFQNVDLEPLEDAGISLHDDPRTFDLLDGSEMTDSISFVDNVQPPSIMQHLDLSLQSDSGVSAVGSSRPDSGSTSRSRIPQFKSRLVKSGGGLKSNRRTCSSSAESSSSASCTLPRRSASANRYSTKPSIRQQSSTSTLNCIDSPLDSIASDNSSDACHTPTGDTFTIRRGSHSSPMPEYSASFTPLEQVNPPSAMGALSAMSSTYGSINSLCSDLCDSLGSFSDMPNSIGTPPPPQSPLISGSRPLPAVTSVPVSSATIRRATIARPVQRPVASPAPVVNGNNRTQINNGFQTYRKSAATKAVSSGTSSTSARNVAQNSTLPRPISNKMSAPSNQSSRIASTLTPMPASGSNGGTLVRRRTTSNATVSGNNNRAQPTVNSDKPEVRSRPTQSKSAGEISSMQQSTGNVSNKNGGTLRKSQSKIASLWKRTVSGQQQQQISPITTIPIKKTTASGGQKQGEKVKVTNCRALTRSMTSDDGSSNTASTSLIRSGTFEKLPITDEEAARIVASSGNKSKVRPVDGSRKLACRQFS
jgi:hypothetical protein